MRKFQQTSELSSKIGALPRIELGKLALVTRLSTPPPYYRGNHFPVSTIHHRAFKEQADS